MYMSVVASVFFGFILLVAVTLALPAGADDRPLHHPTSWVAAMGQSWGTFILFICCFAQFFCLTASVTSASRMLFAFSRDRAVPGHQLWRRVGAEPDPQVRGHRHRRAASAALMLPTLYNFFVGYYVGTGIAVIGLYIAFILPVDPAYRMKDEFEPGAWSLGKHYRWIDPIAIVWVFFISIVFLMPPYSISAPWKDGVHVGGRELRSAPRRRGSAPLRRLVGALCPSGSRARCAWARRKSSSSWRRRQKAFAVPADTALQGLAAQFSP